MGKGKCQVVPVRTIKAYKRNEGITPLTLNVATRLTSYPSPVPQGKNPVTY